MRTLPAGSGDAGPDAASLKTGSRARIEGASGERAVVEVPGELARPPEPQPSSASADAPALGARATPTDADDAAERQRPKGVVLRESSARVPLRDSNARMPLRDSTARVPLRDSAARMPRARTLPPLDPTVSGRRTPVRKSTLPTPKPVLASECLRDDIAPLEPATRATRGWYLASGVTLATIGLTLPFAAHATIVDAVVAVALGAMICGATAVRSYRARAIVALVGAAGIAALGLLGLGPAATWHLAPLSHLARFLAPIALAAPLLLRSTYRAYPAIRAAIGVGALLFAVSALHAGGALPWGDQATIAARVVAGLVVFVAALSLLGFMSEETTGGCAIWASCAILAGGASLGVEAFGERGLDLAALLAGLSGAIGIGVAAGAIYQLTALTIGPRARVSAQRMTLPPIAPEHDEAHDSTLGGD